MYGKHIPDRYDGPISYNTSANSHSGHFPWRVVMETSNDNPLKVSGRPPKQSDVHYGHLRPVLTKFSSVHYGHL